VNNEVEIPTASASSPSAAPNSEYLLAAIVESSEDAIVSKTLDGIITSWNKSARRMFGYTAEEMIGQSILRLIPEALHAEESEILRKIRAGERIEHCETTRVKKNGETIEVSLTISPIWDNLGRVIGSSKIAHDISARRRASEALFRLAAIVESSEDAILSKSLDGIITSWNQAAYRMFGYTAEEIIGQSILLLIPEELHSEESEILRKLAAGERIEHYETTRVKKNGDTVEVALTISPVRDATGQVIGTSKIARDITARKQMERLLIQSEKLAATGRMAATVAHEINNPLESVMNLIFLARENSSVDSKARGYLQTAEEEIERVSHIARQTLGFYRDTGRPVEVLPHELIQDVLAVYQTKLRGRDISVECQFDGCQPIAAKKGELIQVFSNILANSIDAMPHGGLLRVGVTEKSDAEIPGVQIIFHDRGIGIESEDLERVFEPFFSTKGNLGNGIGLWIAKQLIESHGGEITMTSSTNNGSSGTTVLISLPFTNERRGLVR
jgi:PAS domain S-box-containing protein